MINKRLMIFAIFFISLLAISGVSASEIDSDIAINDDNMAIDVGEIDNDNLESADLQLDDNSDNKEMDDNENEENFKSSSNSELLTEDNPDGTFTDLANEIENANGELNLTRNYVFNQSADSRYYRGITIDKVLTINGNGYYINGNDKAMAFNITSANVFLENIIFLKCNTTFKLGSVYWSGVNGCLSGCSFVSCSANSSGAVYWSGVNGCLSGCSFVSCSAKSNKGGAVYWYGENGSLSDCSFVNCSAKSNDGGAVYWYGENGSLSDCSFVSCSAKSNDGGAVYWYGENGSLSDCSFLKCSAGYGGAVYWYDKSGYIRNCSFVNCSSNTYGAVYWYGENGCIRNCSFVNCSAKDNGGAVYWSGVNGNFSGCSFLNCSAKYNGGAVYWRGESGNFSGCSFVNCLSDTYGIVYWYGVNGNFSGCSFVNCSALNGGAVHWYGVNGSISDSSFMDCNSSGTVYWSGESGCLSGCSFVNCSVESWGGAVYWSGASGCLSGCSFLKCSALNGGAVHWYGVNGSISDSSFVSCSAKDNGGAVYWYGVNGSVLNCSFVDCNFSGAVYWFGASGCLSGCSFVNSSSNYSSKFGGAVYWFGVNGSVLNCSFVNSSSNYVVNVTFNETDIDFDVNDIIWGDNITITPTIGEGATGILDIYVDGIFNTTINVDESLVIPFFVGGYHNITVYYFGDGYYPPVSRTRGFNVIRLNSTVALEGNLEPNNSATVYLTLNEDATGTARIYIKNNWYSSTLENGVATFSIPNLTAGNYSVLIDYDGDDKYDSIYEYEDLEITLKKPSLNFEIENILNGSNVIIRPIVTSGASGTLEIYVDNVYTSAISVGSSYTLVKPSIGKHEVKIVYSGDSYHESCENKTVFRVFTFYPIELTNTAIIYGTGKHLQATFYDEYGDVLVNKYVAFNFNNSDYIVQTDENGVAIFDMDLEIGEYSVTAINTMVNEEKTILLNVFTSVVSQNMTRAYNTGIDFEVQLLDEDANPLINGFAIFEVNGNNYTARTNNNGMAILNINLDLGTYEIFTINVATGENKTNSITIVPSIYANDTLRAYNSGIDFKAKFLDENANILVNQTMTFVIDSVYYNAKTDENGFAILNAKLPVGEYEVLIINNVTGERATRNLIIVERIVENEDVFGVYGKNIYYTVGIIGDDGNFVGENEIVKFTINDNVYQIATDKKGYATMGISENIGFYEIYAEYKEFIVSNGIYVLENTGPTISIDLNDGNYNDDILYAVSLSSHNPGAYLEFKIIGDNGYGQAFYVDATDSFEDYLTGLDASMYLMTVDYYDLVNYRYSNATKVFNVFKIDPKIIVVVENGTNGSNATITVNIPGVSGDVIINVGDELVYRENLIKDGVIIKKISNLSTGYYQVDVTYVGDENYNSLTQSTELYFESNSSLSERYVLNIEQQNFDYGSANVILSIYDKKLDKYVTNANIALKFSNGLGINLTIGSDGSAVYKLPLNPGKYIVQMLFKTNKVTLAKAVNISIKSPTSISSKAMTVSYNDGKYLVATLQDSKGTILKNKKVSINLNGKTYNLTTNSSGQVRLLISLIPKTYTAAISFAGDSNYMKSSTSVKVVVKKATPKLTAKAKTFKRSVKTKKYTITLKTNKGKVMENTKVSLRVNKKTFYAKTNKKGVATFKITNLKKKGKFTAVVKYAGSKYYNKVTKKPRITIKA